MTKYFILLCLSPQTKPTRVTVNGFHDVKQKLPSFPLRQIVSAEVKVNVKELIYIVKDVITVQVLQNSCSATKQNCNKIFQRPNGKRMFTSSPATQYYHRFWLRVKQVSLLPTAGSTVWIVGSRRFAVEMALLFNVCWWQEKPLWVLNLSPSISLTISTQKYQFLHGIAKEPVNIVGMVTLWPCKLEAWLQLQKLKLMLLDC